MQPKAEALVLLATGALAPGLLAFIVLAGDSDGSRRAAFVLVCAAIATLATIKLLRWSPPWRPSHGPAVLVAAAVWAVSVLAAGDPFGLLLVVLPLSAVQLLLVAAGGWHVSRGRTERAVAFGRVTGIGCLLGLAVGAGIVFVLLLVLD